MFYVKYVKRGKMKKRFIEKYNVYWDESNSVEGEFGIFVNNKYRRSNIEIELMVKNVLPGLLDVIRKKINDDNIKIMEYSKHSDLELYLLENNDEDFVNPLNNTTDTLIEDFENLLGNRGNIIVFKIEVNDKRYDFFISDTGGDILTRGRAYTISDQPRRIERKNTLIINPNNLIYFKDYTEDFLVIKDTKRASILLNLDQYYKNKAKELLANTVENINNLNLNKTQIEKILRKSECYKIDYITENKENFIDVMKSHNIKYISDNETVLLDETTPSIILEQNELDLYIDGLNKVIKMNPISGEKREVIE